MDVSLHCLTQHPLKHKRVTKLLCLWKEQRIQPLCHQRSAILGTTLNNYSFVSSRIRKFRDSLRWKKPPRPSSPTFDQTNSNSEFEFSFKEAVLQQKYRIFSLDVVFVQQPLGRWQLTELLHMFLLLFIKNAVLIVPTAFRCYSHQSNMKGHVSFLLFGKHNKRLEPCHLLLHHH